MRPRKINLNTLSMLRFELSMSKTTSQLITNLAMLTSGWYVLFETLGRNCITILFFGTNLYYFGACGNMRGACLVF
jgi:hypothetical protein